MTKLIVAALLCSVAAGSALCSEHKEVKPPPQLPRPPKVVAFSHVHKEI